MAREPITQIAAKRIFTEDALQYLKNEADLITVTKLLQPVVGLADDGTFVTFDRGRRLVIPENAQILGEVAGNTVTTIVRPGGVIPLGGGLGVPSGYTRRVRKVHVMSATYTPGAAPQTFYALTAQLNGTLMRLAAITTPVASKVNNLLDHEVILVQRDDDIADLIFTITQGQAAETFSLTGWTEEYLE